MSRFPICTHWRWQLSDLVFPGGRNRCCTKSRTEALSRASIRLSRPFRRGQASTVTLDEGPSLRHALVRRPTVRRRTHRVGGRPVGGGPRRAMARGACGGCVGRPAVRLFDQGRQTSGHRGNPWAGTRPIELLLHAVAVGAAWAAWPPAVAAVATVVVVAALIVGVPRLRWLMRGAPR